METMFPMFVKLAGRMALVVGAGTVAEGKVEGLLDTGATIRVVATRATERIRDWARSGAITFEQRAFASSDLDGAFLVVVATSSASVNELVFREANARGVLCNVVDVPNLCDFFYPSVVRRGDLQIAVSTAGQSPSLAQKIRQQLERHFGPGYGEWVAELGRTRREILDSDLEADQKKALLQSLASREAFEAMRAAKRTLGSQGEAA
ncbi:MAG: bifunctional precorrin-2 dehydrogenase/sirohydrochlorin ferrochelatase [Acidobacteriaceae bacterium]|nr:bifunctional precorrin-2 dehydrogenase/sirohydrochlorin ferrochelatase [Acidobacteriaceae bacterium]